MYKLSKAAQAAGVTLLNEVGLDPGIDHMLAMQCIDEVSRQGGTVESFISWCGGLPAPEFSNNPLRYKFSWSPRTVLANLKNSAKYLKNGTLVDIPAGGWLMQSAMPVDVLPGFNLEGIPNRDSTVFSEKYGLSCAHTVLRGTLRFTGYCNAAQALDEVGLLDDRDHPRLQPTLSPVRWCDLMGTLISETDARAVDLKSSVYELLGRDLSKLNTLEKLGLLSEENVALKGTPLDTLTAYLEKTLAYSTDWNQFN
jgi:alpha-aminoadipic semialdehyde synthase